MKYFYFYEINCPFFLNYRQLQQIGEKVMKETSGLSQNSEKSWKITILFSFSELTSYTSDSSQKLSPAGSTVAADNEPDPSAVLGDFKQATGPLAYEWFRMKIIRRKTCSDMLFGSLTRVIQGIGLETAAPKKKTTNLETLPIQVKYLARNYKKYIL